MAGPPAPGSPAPGSPALDLQLLDLQLMALLFYGSKRGTGERQTSTNPATELLLPSVPTISEQDWKFKHC